MDILEFTEKVCGIELYEYQKKLLKDASKRRFIYPRGLTKGNLRFFAYLNTWNTLTEDEQNSIYKLCVAFPVSWTHVMEVFLRCNRSYTDAKKVLRLHAMGHYGLTAPVVFIDENVKERELD